MKPEPVRDEAAVGQEVGAAGERAETDLAETDVADIAELPPPTTGHLTSIVESLLFAADKPLTVARLQEILRERTAAGIEAALAELCAVYADRGIVVHEVAGGYQLRTHPASSPWVQRLIAGRKVRLTRAQLESLAIIAYRQPITRPEIEDIRGVDSGSSLKVLLDRSLIRILGKKEEPGRPLLYGTTREFLAFFNLKNLRDLPTLREFSELSEDSLREVEKLDEGAQFAAGDDAPVLAEVDELVS
jgi:segregation and condensation protein B